jgi:hypothetical protein
VLAACLPPRHPLITGQLQQPAKGKENPRIWGRLLLHSITIIYVYIREEKAQTERHKEKEARCVRAPVCISAEAAASGVEGRGSPIGRPRGERAGVDEPAAAPLPLPSPPPRAHTHAASTESVHYEPFTGQELC